MFYGCINNQQVCLSMKDIAKLSISIFLHVDNSTEYGYKMLLYLFSLPSRINSAENESQLEKF